MEHLRNKFLRLLGSVGSSPRRYLYDQINWDERFIIITGQRGVGKTTLVLQHIKSYQADLEDVLYVSLDDIYFSAHSLTELVEEFVMNGGRYLFIDEAHRYPGWTQEIKNIYDFYRDLQIIVTGSSALSFFISSADLGRRAAVYHLPELSFREYLYFSGYSLFEPLELQDILKDHEKIALEINTKIKSVKLFREYIRYGAFPFFLEGREKYTDKVEWMIHTVIDNDIPAIENIGYESRLKIKKFLLMMATSVPFRVNISELSRKLATSRDVFTHHLNLLSRAGIITLLTTEGTGHVLVRKPDKIYFSNPNLLFSLNEQADTGTMRETFFLNQMKNRYRVTYPRSGDFLIDNKYLFEVGGKNKTLKQVKDHPGAFLAVDDVEYGHKKSIPLWLFGFLY